MTDDDVTHQWLRQAVVDGSISGWCATQVMAILDEARATIARLEQDAKANAAMLARQCDLAREAETRAEAAEARLRAMEDERDTARRETQDNIRCAVETRARLRAVVEVLNEIIGGFDSAVFVRNIEWDHQPDWSLRAAKAVAVLARAKAALRLAAGAGEKEGI